MRLRDYLSNQDTSYVIFLNVKINLKIHNEANIEILKMESAPILVDPCLTYLALILALVPVRLYLHKQAGGLQATVYRYCTKILFILITEFWCPLKFCTVGECLSLHSILTLVNYINFCNVFKLFGISLSFSFFLTQVT